MYKPGTLKLTWINPNDYTVLQSKMFNANNLNYYNTTLIGTILKIIFEIKETKFL